MSECEGQMYCIILSIGVANSVYLFCLFTTLIGITTLKYKNYGFILKLLVILDFGAVMLLVN